MKNTLFWKKEYPKFCSLDTITGCLELTLLLFKEDWIYNSFTHDCAGYKGQNLVHGKEEQTLIFIV